MVAKTRALTLALWLQSLYRGNQGRKLAARKRAKLNKQRGQFVGGLTKMMTGLLYEPTPSADLVSFSSSSQGEEEGEVLDLPHRC